ncbi:uncharacterized protein N7511_007419 [Penicillium nucicola]|uniref:uncharacterized protein n=1 Tax=Penicillium nucicola TaxID=1850975 RepID=UPI002545B24C|nr:uncharacterized protein N7511_007419 [Penicillium nucicola]KAJ5757237.1 hypothetical protein N7511_007419 [Penicillium nucicola]
MEQYPAHWKSTLMGVEFWKDAAIYEEEVAKKRQQALTPNLLNQSPVNMASGQAGTEQADTEKAPHLQDIPKRRRRLSTADLPTISSLRRHPSVRNTTARIKGLAHHVRTRSFSAATNLDRKLSIDTTSKVFDGPKSTTVHATEILSPPPITPLGSPTTSDLATPVKPILLFRGGTSWGSSLD